MKAAVEIDPALTYFRRVVEYRPICQYFLSYPRMVRFRAPVVQAQASLRRLGFFTWDDGSDLMQRSSK
jgi:hypothetical protein